MKYEIKNWSQFQQYKDDRPLHWIKLHNSLLDDFSFNQLSETLQLQLLKLWLVASKTGGKVEGDDKWLAQLTKLKKVDINQLITSGFIIRTDLYENIQEIPREEKRREEESREDNSRIENTIVPLKRNHAKDVFVYWQSIMDHPKAAYDNKREALIKKNLSHYSSEDLKKAIHGCSLTPHNMGDNDRGERYDSIELIFRTSSQIDRFMKNSDNPPSGNIKTIEQTNNEALAQVERVKKHLGFDNE